MKTLRLLLALATLGATATASFAGDPPPPPKQIDLKAPAITAKPPALRDLKAPPVVAKPAPAPTAPATGQPTITTKTAPAELGLTKDVGKGGAYLTPSATTTTTGTPGTRGYDSSTSYGGSLVIPLPEGKKK